MTVVQCPYCFEKISIFVDSGGSREQSFSYDCTVCCRPLLITLQLDEDGAKASAEREV
jgi:hypothetical protein